MQQQDISTGSQKQLDDDQDNILSNLDFIRFLTVAQKNFHWIIFIFVLGVFFSFLFLRYTKPIFQSKSLVKYDVKQVSPLFSSEQMQADNYSYLLGEIELIKSKIIYEKAVNLLPLDVSYFAYGRINNMERYLSSPFLIKYYELTSPDFYDKPMDVSLIDQNNFVLSFDAKGNKYTETHRFGDIVQTPYFKIIIGKSGKSIDEDEVGKIFYFTINSKESQQRYIASKLEVKVTNSEAKTLEIAFSDYDKVKARDIVNVIDSVYMVQTILKKNQAQEQSIAFLNEQLRMTEQNLDEYEQKIENFAKENKTTDISSEFSKYLGKAELEVELLEKLRSANNTLSKLEEAIYNDESIEKILPLLTHQEGNEELVQVANKLYELQLKLKHALETSKEKTFAIKSIKADISNTRDVLIDLTTQYRKLITEEMGKSQHRIKEFENAFSVLPSKETEHNKLKRFYDLYEKFYLMLIDKKAEYGISKAGTVPEFQILSSPGIAQSPVYPNSFEVYFIGIAAAFFVSFFLVVFQYFLHNTINNIGELERSCLAPILGVVPNFKKSTSDFSTLIVDQFPKSPVSEALRSIRTNTEFMAKGRSNKIISVTSTISGEGKTFVAINLGGIIAMSDQKVIILDLDLRKPKISKAFNSENLRGISTLLIGRSELEDTILQTSIPSYYFIPSGPVPPNPSELIMSSAFDELLEKLKTKFDVIILDTPPVGIVTDGILAMKKSDLNIYIVRAEYSKKGFESNINNLLIKSKFNNLSVILNNFDSLKSYAYGYKYGYGQGYGYGEYYQMEDTSLKKGIMERIKKMFS
jgi:capsular exopolysaccharide synthesis family protein